MSESLHTPIYTETEIDCWKHLGIALHYLLDAIYHLFLKASSNVSICCKWCNCKIDSWAELLAKTVGEAAPLPTYTWT